VLFERELEAEIRKTLRELTAAIASYKEPLKEFHSEVIRTETFRARARYSRNQGCFAKVGASIKLVAAKHPLLGLKAAPIDFAPEAGVRTVIITGPNTGGKTVALKTLGLLALMNQSGLAIPVEEGTVLPVFGGVYADIGDEQSISQSLSTFSAHMTNIALIVQSISAQKEELPSLVLLDELGSGTDPQEGSAIAMALLDELGTKQNNYTIVTTHHGALKNYGYTRPGVENASVEFDGATLSPTYRIVMGLPGESRALEIAARNGFPKHLLDAAARYLAGERSDVSLLIKELERKRAALEKALRKARLEDAGLKERCREADLRDLRLRQKEHELKAESVGRFERLLSESRKTLENLVRELKEKGGDIGREDTLKVRDFLQGLQEQVIIEEQGLHEEALASVHDAEEPSPETLNRPIAVGVEVEVLKNRQRGRVIRPSRRAGNAEIQAWVVEVGSVKLTLPESELKVLPPQAHPVKPLIASPDLIDGAQAQLEINLRGMRLADALLALQKQIDAALLQGLGSFAVVHGKGDGILQEGVHKYLKEQPAVADYYFSRPELGGFGRTEVLLK
jgi:DNA mismatch repair protein MutS2